MRRRLIGFDLDGTLAVTKSPIPDLIAQRLAELLALVDVCVVSGGDFTQFQQQLIARLDVAPTHLARLHLLPTTGTRYFRYDPVADAWCLQYSEDLAPQHRDAAIGVLTDVAKSLGYWESDPTGDIIEDRGSQVTFSALGQRASPDAKYAWDPDGAKRRSMRDRVASALPDLEVHVGGQTSIDVTNSGVDKAYAMRKLMAILGLGAPDVLFFGDQLGEGGNDHPVEAMGIDTIAVEGWRDSALAIEAIVAVAS
jgi:HAD superfamily hydrolase (TIGR01484 family)